MNFLRKAVGYKTILRPPQRSKLCARARLIDLMHETGKTSPFYKNQFDLFLQNTGEMSDDDFFYAYSHMPIVTQNDIQTYAEKIAAVSTENTNKTEIPDLTSLLLKKKYLVRIKTQNADYNINDKDANLFLHTMLRSFKKLGWKEGDNLIALYPEQNLPDAIKNLSPFALKHFLGITLITYTTIDEQLVASLKEACQKTKPRLLATTPDTLINIASILQKPEQTPIEHLPAIHMSLQSPLLDCNKKMIQSCFPDSDIQCAYICPYLGIIAHQSSLNNNEFDVFEDLFYCEQGSNNTIIITSYDQTSFPLIRYETGHMARVITEENGTQRFEMLEGAFDHYLIGADGYMYYPSFFNALINEINKVFGDPVTDFTIKHAITPEGESLLATITLNDQSKTGAVYQAATENLRTVFANHYPVDVVITNTLSVYEPQHKIVTRDHIPPEQRSQNAHQHRLAS